MHGLRSSAMWTVSSWVPSRVTPRTAIAATSARLLRRNMTPIRFTAVHQQCNLMIDPSRPFIGNASASLEEDSSGVLQGNMSPSASRLCNSNALINVLQARILRFAAERDCASTVSGNVRTSYPGWPISLGLPNLETVHESLESLVSDQ